MISEVIYPEFIEEKPVVRQWIDEKGKEVLSDKPVSIPLPVTPSPASMTQLIQQLYMQMSSGKDDFESPEDADDFDVSDELGIEMRNTPYEQDFDHLAEAPAVSAGSVEPSPQPEKVEGTPA